jgi:hypothetical protein
VALPVHVPSVVDSVEPNVSVPLTTGATVFTGAVPDTTILIPPDKVIPPVKFIRYTLYLIYQITINVL